MANPIRIKRRASGNAGAPASLENAELAFNEVDDTLYYGKGTGGAGGTATTVEPIGGKGAVVMLTGAQTVPGEKTFNDLKVPEPTAAGHAVNKAYADALVPNVVAGSGITVTPAAGSVTIAQGASGVTAGTYPKVTVDAMGRVTAGAALAASDVPTLNQSTTGNAATATKLATARTINGVAFDGTANITVADATKAPLASPALTGTPTAPTALPGANTLQIANTAFVAAAIAAMIDSAPGALDTLNELAAALGDDPNYAGTVTTSLAGKQPLDATLTALAGLTTAADRMIYATGADTFALATLTAFGRSLIAAANNAAARTTLGLGGMATQNANAVAITGGTIDGITIDGGTF